jgi:drug/metabolite transporter (DMT)-like permease
MVNNIKKINLIFRSVLVGMILSLIGGGVFVFNYDPITNYTAMYNFFVILAVILFLIILSIALLLRVKILKNLVFVQEIYKLAWNSLVFGFAGVFVVLLAYTSTLSAISGGIVAVCLAAYCGFEFLD